MIPILRIRLRLLDSLPPPNNEAWLATLGSQLGGSAGLPVRDRPNIGDVQTMKQIKQFHDWLNMAIITGAAIAVLVAAFLNRKNIPTTYRSVAWYVAAAVAIIGVVMWIYFR
jgi:hypothetical protein